MDDSGGWLWIVADVALVAVLGAAIWYGYSQWRRKRTDPAMKAAEREAVKDLYRQDTK